MTSMAIRCSALFGSEVKVIICRTAVRELKSEKQTFDVRKR